MRIGREQLCVGNFVFCLLYLTHGKNEKHFSALLSAVIKQKIQRLTNNKCAIMRPLKGTSSLVKDE